MESTNAVSDWAGGSLVPRVDCEPTETELLVADSFLVREGRVLALGLHRARFLDSVREQGAGDRGDVEAFWAAAVAALPSHGDWFPRFEAIRVRGAARLRFRLRSAPQLSESLVVMTAAHDPRRTPRVKGPDIERLGALRQAAQKRGAQEAVILDEGFVSDGATSALLWWRGGMLCAPPLSLPRVDSVAARTLRGIAAALGVPVDEEEAAPPDLEGTELWAVNALHGIRLVTRWIDGPSLARDPARFAAWRGRFDALARPLPGPGDRP
ncbi:aminotransferase class IV [Leifsonia sp. AG29]|uniref:aminotransferase class IV n=1 Tax=Leifsonia sp. AG29 TaxID=2598860 RepID=UPI00131D347B|nr:aminotransferase class IV [Leifsonia sp. AG29]